MKKIDYFLEALESGLYKRRAWVISVFSIINEGPDDWKKDPYPYRLVQTPTGFFFVNPNDISELVNIVDYVKDSPLLTYKTLISLKAKQLLNLTKDITTTAGQILINYVLFIYPFKDKVTFVEGRFSPGYAENLLLDRLTDDVPEPDLENKELIYVSEYLQFCDAAFYLSGFAQTCVPGASPKSIVPAPGIHELRNRLIEENKERLHDPAVIAKIDKELVAYDTEYLKGDISTGFLIKPKAMNIVRKKMFGMHGAETGLEEKVEVDLIKNSLSEGWDVSKFPVMNNSLRAGSFNRGALTMLGGESVKWLLRASSNISVTVDDCGSLLGNVRVIPSDSKFKYVGFSIVDNKKIIKLTKENISEYYGKSVVMRGPMFCQQESTDFCKTCVGDRLSSHPTGLSTAVSEYGSSFLYIFMSGAHSKALLLSKMNYKEALT